jgi:ribosomal protein L11 methylase PrmA
MVSIGNLDDTIADSLLRDYPKGFDLIVANILAPVLISLAPYFLRLLAIDGTLIISGVLEGKFDHVSAALDPLVSIAQCDLEGWSAVAFSHETNASISSRKGSEGTAP